MGGDDPECDSLFNVGDVGNERERRGLFCHIANDLQPPPILEFDSGLLILDTYSC